MSHLKAVTDDGRPPEPETDQEMLAAALVAVRRCQQTALPNHVKIALEAVEGVLERHIPPRKLGGAA